jgi:tRNA (guanine37-N1)-methyltransferase
MAPRIDIVTLFVEMFDGFCSVGVVGRAIQRNLIEVHRTNIRDFATDNYGTVDDAPFGGGVGMVLKCEPVYAAVEHVQALAQPPGKVILLSPQGEPLTQGLAAELAGLPRLVLLAGHYEGFDERIRPLADREVSIGDFVLSGGEVAAMAVVDAVVRLIPGVLGKDESVVEESFSDGLLEYPQYTRPREFRGMTVPEVLLGGDHEKIRQWRAEQSQQRTRQRRPDLWDRYVRRKTQEDQRQGDMR